MSAKSRISVRALLAISLLTLLFSSIIIEKDYSLAKKGLEQPQYFAKIAMTNNEGGPQIVSELKDTRGDSNIGYLDVISASILQINSELLQFNIEMKEDIPLIHSIDTYIAIIWLLDVDEDKSTGQSHRFVGSEYNVRVALDNGVWGGHVDVTVPLMEGGGTANVFIENCTASILINIALVGSHDSFAWETYVFASGDVQGADSADEYSTVLLNLFDPLPGQICEVRVAPAFIHYSKGKLSNKIQAFAFDTENRLLYIKNSDVSFFVPEVTVATFNYDSLDVKEIGLASIIAKVDGVVSINKGELMCGRISLLPPILLLSIENGNTGQLYLDIEAPNGTRLTVNDVDIEFESSNPDVAFVDSNGLVTAVRPPDIFRETPRITARVNNIWIENSAIVRVTQEDLNIRLTSYDGEHVSIYTADNYGPYRWGELIQRFEAVRVSDIIYELSCQLTGVTPFSGNTQFLVLDPGYHSDETVPCGLSGNPVRLGLGVDNLRSCFGLRENLQWGIWYHEMGHNFRTNMRRELSRMKHDYEEAIATIVGIACVDSLLERSELYDLSRETIKALTEDDVSLLPTHGRIVFIKEGLYDYVRTGADYSTINPDILDGIFLTLQEEYGSHIFYDFFSTIQPEPSAWINLETEEKEATYFVAALSASTGEDLRRRFRDNWGFPVDDAFYESIMPTLNIKINQRKPQAITEEFIPSSPNRTIQLNGNKSYDLMGSDLNYNWKIISKPENSKATLSQPTIATPTILVDAPGEYIINLTVSNNFRSSNPSTVKIEVKIMQSLSIHVFRNNIPVSSTIQLFNENKAILSTDKNVNTFERSLIYGTYYVQATVIYNNYNYTSELIETDLIEDTDLIIEFLFGNLTITCVDIENRPLKNCTLLLTRGEESRIKSTDRTGTLMIEAYYGNWNVQAFWKDVPVGEARIDINSSTLEFSFQFNVSCATTLSCSASTSEITGGESITVSGFIAPALSDKSVSLSYKKPDGITFTRAVTTGSDGFYSDFYSPDADGSWRVTASWDGDSMHEGASSSEVEFIVNTGLIGGPGWTDDIVVLGGISIIIVISLLLIIRKTKGSARM